MLYIGTYTTSRYSKYSLAKWRESYEIGKNHASCFLRGGYVPADGLRRNAEKCRQLGVTMQPRTGEEAVQNGIGIGFGWYCVHEPAYTRFLVILSISAFFLQEV